MGAYTAQELDNIANSVLDFHIKGKAKSQIDQDRPLFDDLTRGQEFFPGGKEFITTPVKGQYDTTMVGYSHDDEVSFVNPANTKRAQWKWYELSGGISITLTELKAAGISVVDSMTSERTSSHSRKDMIELTNLLTEKFDDMDEGSKRSFAEMLWRDGTQDSKAVPGVQSIITTTPTTGVKGGLDSAALTFWRNRVSLNIDSSTATNQNLVNTLQKEVRQLRRFAKAPKFRAYAGSDLMDAFEKELRALGNYTETGWANKGKIDASIADIAFKGVDINYEPLLDDLSLSKFLYWLDLSAIKLMPMEDEAWKLHTPARPPQKYVMYRSHTWTGALCAKQLNSSGVYSIL
jgi:hypothetical protein